MNNVGDFIQWLFFSGGNRDLSGFVSGLVEYPLFGLYFILAAAVSVLLAWGTLRVAFPRGSLLRPPQWNMWFGLLMLILAALLQFVVAWVAAAIMGRNLMEIVKGPLVISLSVIIPAPVICIVAYRLLDAVSRGRAIDIGISRHGALRNFGRGLLFIIMLYPLLSVVSGLNNAVLNTIHADTSEQSLVGMYRSATNVERALMFLMAVVATPVWEEFIFRGAIFNGMRRSVGRDEAILLSAVFFAALHGNLAAMAPIVFLGIFLAYAYERTGSLWTPIGMHALSNAMNLVPIMFGA